MKVKSSAMATQQRRTRSRSAAKARRKKQNLAMLKVIAGIIGMIVIVAGFSTMINNRPLTPTVRNNTSTRQGAETLRTQEGVYFEGVNISRMTRDEVRSAIDRWVQSASWDLTLSCQGNIIPLEKCLHCTDSLLDEIFDKGSGFAPVTTAADAQGEQASALTGEEGDAEGTLAEETVAETADPNIYFTAESLFDEDAARAQIAAQEGKFDTTPVNSVLTGFDREYEVLTFSESAPGYVLDTESTLALVRDQVESRNYSGTIEAVYNAVEPEFTEEKARSEYSMIGTFTTGMAYDENRVHNIKLACDTLTGVMIKPGEIFSFNDYIGATTEDKGYKDAGAFQNGKVVKEPGGGVCQVSSTLYNALIRAGLTVTERHHHSMPVTYVTLGMDAMVYYPSSDLKFFNNSDGTIVLFMLYFEETCNAYVYGKPILGEGITKELASQTLEVIDAKPVYVEDPTLKPGEEVIEGGNLAGAKVETWLITYEYGTEIDREYLHTSTYQPMSATIRRNTTKVEETKEDTTKEDTTKETGEKENNEAETTEGEHDSESDE